MIPTEPIGSIPRPPALIEAVAANGGNTDDPALEPLFDDGDPRHDRALRGDRLAGHHRRRAAQVSQLLGLLRSRAAEHGARRLQDPVRRRPHAPDAAADRGAVPLQACTRIATSRSRSATRRVPVKQAVISPSALSLLYPADGIPGYSREQFIEDLLTEHVGEVRRCLAEGRARGADRLHRGPPRGQARSDGRAARELHRSQQPRARAVHPEERKRIGVHTCPGGDRDSTHSADVDYAELLPSLLQLNLTNFYVALAGERDRRRVLGDHPRAPASPASGSSSASSRRSIRASRRRRRCATASSRPPSTSRSTSSAPPTTAASRRSATTRRPRATRRSRRSRARVRGHRAGRRGPRSA